MRPGDSQPRYPAPGAATAAPVDLADLDGVDAFAARADEELERAETGDDVWNLAQRGLLAH